MPAAIITLSKYRKLQKSAIHNPASKFVLEILHSSFPPVSPLLFTLYLFCNFFERSYHIHIITLYTKDEIVHVFFVNHFLVCSMCGGCSKGIESVSTTLKEIQIIDFSFQLFQWIQSYLIFSGNTVDKDFFSCENKDGPGRFHLFDSFAIIC